MLDDVRIGKIIEAESLQDGKYVTHKLLIDFGSEIGIKPSLASLVRYTREQLMGKLVVAVVNQQPKRIGNHVSEVVILGSPNGDGECVLITPDADGATIGGKVY